MSDDAGPSRWEYGGLFAITLATLMHEILLTRIFSVTMWYHFAFMAISIAMFGMTAGAILVYVRPAPFEGKRLPRTLVLCSSAYALTLVLGFVAYLQVPFIGDDSPKSLAFLALSYAIIAVPFVFSGVTVAAVLSRFRAQAGSLYAADLLGAALGCVLLVVTLDVTDAATAVLVVGTIGAGSALLFSRSSDDQKLRQQVAGLAVVLAGFTAVHSVLGRDGKPPLRIVDTAHQAPEFYHYVRWNAHSRVTVSGNPFEPTGAAGWGLSEKTGAAHEKVRQLGMSIDTWAGTVITAFDGNTKPLWYLKDDVTNLAHHLRTNADVFVVGVGGGRDVLAALVFDQKSVTGVEVNKDVLRATTEVFGEFAGHIDRNPKVTLAVDEARSYLTRLDRRFDIVQLSLIDTWAATAAGAFVLTENSLYTAEAWQTFLEHLTPRGILTVSRWYYPTRPGEAIRITSLAREALERMGVAHPRDHVVMVKAPKASGMPGLFGNGVATILVGREPFSPEDIATLRAEVDRLGFEFVIGPTEAENPIYTRILSEPDPAALYASLPLDVSPPTDDRPFFFQMLRLRDVTKPLSEHWLDPNKSNLRAVRLLAVLSVIMGVLTLACIVGPLAFKARRGTVTGSAPLLTFFVAIGLGFMFIELSEMQRLMLLLGKPTYALSVVLFTLLVGSGTGSLVSARVAGPNGLFRPSVALALLLAVLVAAGLATPLLVRSLAASSTPVRILATAAMLLPMGFFMGLPFPLGLRAAKTPDIVPWLWGLNGAASVLCSVLATVVALGQGISFSFWCGVACYVGALAAYLAAERAPSAASATTSPVGITSP
jgi:hypothetical protein